METQFPLTATRMSTIRSASTVSTATSEIASEIATRSTSRIEIEIEIEIVTAIAIEGEGRQRSGRPRRRLCCRAEEPIW